MILLSNAGGQFLLREGTHMKKGIGCLTSLLLLAVLVSCGMNWPVKILELAEIIKPTVQASFAEPNTSPEDILLVNNAHALPEGYAPEQLVNLYEQRRFFQLANSDIYLERATFEAANRMFEQAEKDDINGFIITSGYRSAEKQAEVYAQQQDGTASKPGYSEHQTGLAFDVTAMRDGGGFEETPQFAWLIEHCWDYGFILRYPSGKEGLTGIPYEPWHYRYVGVEIAQTIRRNGWTLEEYCESARKN